MILYALSHDLKRLDKNQARARFVPLQPIGSIFCTGCVSGASCTDENSTPTIQRWQSASFASSRTISSAPTPPEATPVLRKLEAYAATLTGADSTKEKKLAVITKLKATWFGIDSLPLRTVKPSQVQTWLAKQYGQSSASHYNAALTVIRDALQLAVQDKVLIESPADGLKYQTRTKPIRLTPTLFAHRNSTVRQGRAATL